MMAMVLTVCAGPPVLAQDATATGGEAATDEAQAADEAPAPARAKKKAYTIPERFVLVDPANGLAISGYDPVAYFVDHRARPGRREHELVWSKTIWTFVNEGNLAAFKGAPQIYAPQFGGHDAQALADGRTAPGDPRVWAIHNQRLYFFHSPARRFEWLIAPDQHVREAEKEWDKRINIRFNPGRGR